MQSQLTLPSKASTKIPKVSGEIITSCCFKSRQISVTNVVDFDGTPSSLMGMRNRHITKSNGVVGQNSSIRNLPFKKLRRLLQRKRPNNIKLCVKLSVLRLFQVGHVVQNRWSALSLAWYEWFSFKGKESEIYYWSGLASSSQPQIWKFHVAVWKTALKNCTKKRPVWLFFFI